MKAPDFLHDESAAKRFRDTVALHRLALTNDEVVARRFMAIRLSDGGSDNVAYETRADAYRNQLNAEWCGYVQIPPVVWDLHTCDALLNYMRIAYNNGFRPQPGAWLLTPANIEEVMLHHDARSD